MPKLERAFKWREIEYARLTLTDLANVKQLSWATRATIIIWDAHFQVAVERGDILKKKRKMFHLVSRSARICKFWRFLCSCFHNDRYNLDILESLNRVARKKYRRKLCWKLRKMFTAPFFGIFQLSPGCQATVMLTIDSCANVWAPWMAVRVYKTHFSLCGNDRMQWVKTTKLSQTAVCADNYQIYLLTTIRQNHFMKSIIWRWRMSPPSDRTDNSDNTPCTYTDKLLSISAHRAWKPIGWRLPEALLQGERARHWTRSTKKREKKFSKEKVSKNRSQ